MNRSLDTIKPAKNAQTDKGFSGIAIKISKEEMGKMFCHFLTTPNLSENLKLYQDTDCSPKGKKSI